MSHRRRGQSLCSASRSELAETAAPQAELLPVSHDTLQPDRLRKRDRDNPERVYLAEWKRRQHRSPGVNSGAALIEWILAPGRHPVAVSRRDAVVAASVIQWLGTSCGLGFILTCERKVEEQRRDGEEKRLVALQNERLAIERAKPCNPRPPRRRMIRDEA